MYTNVYLRALIAIFSAGASGTGTGIGFTYFGARCDLWACATSGTGGTGATAGATGVTVEWTRPTWVRILGGLPRFFLIAIPARPEESPDANVSNLGPVQLSSRSAEACPPLLWDCTVATVETIFTLGFSLRDAMEFEAGTRALPFAGMSSWLWSDSGALAIWEDFDDATSKSAVSLASLNKASTDGWFVFEAIDEKASKQKTRLFRSSCGVCKRVSYLNLGPGL
jgi:hypothetical protein